MTVMTPRNTEAALNVEQGDLLVERHPNWNSGTVHAERWSPPGSSGSLG